ncbi:MAG TPA: HAD-IA family hydrolase [Patescibacteria group bacterium]|nr:HAD-IA family hydrolase [Patescibacteria group bacterium]
MDEVGLGQRLQEARKTAGLTQQELCHRAGLSYSTLAKIERGAIKSPSVFTIQAIATALGTTLSELMGESPALPAKKYRSKSGIRFVYFDINGCLVRFFHRAFTRLAEDTGASPDVIETTFWHYNDAVCRGEMPLEDFDKALAKQLGVDNLNWMDYYMAAVDPIQEMHELVNWASQYYSVGLLSNIMPGFIDVMFEKGLLPKVAFTAIIDSSKTGAIKPETQIYEAAQNYTNCSPNEILLVDDSRSNLMAAEKMGWHVLWFDDYRPEESAARVKDSLELDSEV